MCNGLDLICKPRQHSDTPVPIMSLLLLSISCVLDALCTGVASCLLGTAQYCLIKSERRPSDAGGFTETFCTVLLASMVSIAR